jgi:hypothetical protein
MAGEDYQLHLDKPGDLFLGKSLQFAVRTLQIFADGR